MFLDALPEGSWQQLTNELADRAIPLEGAPG